MKYPKVVRSNVGMSHGHRCKHDHLPVNQETAIQITRDKITDLIDFNVFDKSWDVVTVTSIKKKLIKEYIGWELSFINDKVIDPAKRVLYINITISGDYNRMYFSEK